MKIPSLIFLVTLGILGSAIAPARAAAPKVEETVLGPINAGGVLVVGANAHVACVGRKEGRLVVTVDGVAGPAFDELYTSTGNSFFFPPQAGAWTTTQGGNDGGMAPVFFSRDGGHHAYAGRQGAEYVVIHDGKEIARGPKEKFNIRYGALTISPGGKFVAWVEVEQVKGQLHVTPIVNGHRGPVSAPQANGWKFVFSPDESRYAYYAQAVDTMKPMLIVDGKDAGYAGRDPVFTADGKVLLSVSFEGGKATILVNGKPSVTGLVVEKLIPAPVGSRWSAIVRTRVENGAGVSAFFLNGKEVPGTEGALQAWFSADGQHYAVTCVNNASRAMHMVMDGKKLAEYPSVGTPCWTPDASRFIYNVTAATRPFLVVNDEEIAIRDMIVPNNQIAMAETGGRYGYMTRDGMNQKFSVMIDGKSVLPSGTYPIDHTLTFTPDGSRYAFFVGDVGRQGITGVVVDGELRKGMTPAHFTKWVTSEVVPTSLVFSRDGKHLAYWLRAGTDANARGIYMDGKRVFPDRRVIYFPTFTPDSQHFCWVADEPAEIRGQPPLTGVYVDGQLAVRVNGYFFSNMPGAWNVDGAGVVTFLAADGNVAKRYRITAPADTSVATLLAAAKEN